VVVAAPPQLEELIKEELRQPIEQLVRQVVVELVREQLNGDWRAAAETAVSGPENGQEPRLRVYALTDYREVDRSNSLARARA
jgi:hypothetical protein